MSSGAAAEEMNTVDYEIARRGLDKVITLTSGFVYTYYNRANVTAMLRGYRATIVDYDRVTQLSSDSIDAYFNRGFTHVFLGDNEAGISDLSRTDELGAVSVYNVIEHFTDQAE